MRAFRTARFFFELEALDSISLPSYKGSTFRGGFGHAFKKTVCALKRQDCDSCLLKEKCVYSYVFETPPPADSAIMRKYPKAPHPLEWITMELSSPWPRPSAIEKPGNLTRSRPLAGGAGGRQNHAVMSFGYDSMGKQYRITEGSA